MSRRTDDPKPPEHHGSDAAEVLAPVYTAEKPPIERGPDHDEPKNLELPPFTHRTPQTHELPTPPAPPADPNTWHDVEPAEPDAHPERRPVTGPPASDLDRKP